MRSGFQISLVLLSLFSLTAEAHAVPAVPVDYSAYPHLDRTEYLDGVNLAVEAYSLWGRDFFAVANENSDLHIYEILDGEVVSKGNGRTVGEDRDLAINGWHAFVATNGGVSAVNVAIPETPFLADFITLPGEPIRIDVSETHAFVACGSGGLVVVDINDPTNLFIAGYYGDTAISVCADGDRVGVVTGNGFEILDVSVPGAPVLLGSYEDAYDAVLQGDLAYVIIGGSLKQLDISDPASIIVNEELPLFENPFHRVEVQGSEIIATDWFSQGFADIATGAVIREVKMGGRVRDAASVGGKIMVVCDGQVRIFEDGLHTNPTAGTVLGATWFDPVGIMLGDILYGLSYQNENMLVATELGTGQGPYLWNLFLNNGGNPVRGVAHQGNKIAILTSDGILSTVTVTRYSAPRRRGILDLPGSFSAPISGYQSVAFLDDQTLVALDRYGAGNIRVVDISDIDNPIQIGQFPVSFDPGLIFKSGSRIIVTASIQGGANVEIFDAQDRLALQSLKVQNVWGGGQSVRTHAHGSWVYSLQFRPPANPAGFHPMPDRLDTWDFSDPVNPVVISQLNLTSSQMPVFAGDWAYQGSTGLILDLSDPAGPIPAGSFSIPFSIPYEFDHVLAGAEYIVVGNLYGSPQGSGRYLAASGATGAVSAVDEDLPNTGGEMTLQAVPNPFNPRVTFRFELAAESNTRLEIFDLRGRRVADLGSRVRQAGAHSITWDGDDTDGRNLPSGVYLARISTPESSASRKIVLAR